ncbi:hypothetical protein DOY81_006117 [Sarcophaga bullata]|nr:hypothetical protein DOY81_006117 [Sarcophaga bullata]
MRVYSLLPSFVTNIRCCKTIRNKTDLMQRNKYLQQQQNDFHEGIHNNGLLWSLPIKKRCNFLAFIFITLFMQHYVAATTAAAAGSASIGGNVDRMIHHYGTVADDGGVRKGFKMRMRSAKIAGIHILQPVPESLPKSKQQQSHKQQQSRNHHPNHDHNDYDIIDGKQLPAVAVRGAIDNQTNTPPAGKFEIRSVSGEPNYKSVNLTWEVEFVPSRNDGVVTNRSQEVLPPTTFQIFFCEIQSFGPHRCRSKVVNDSSSLTMYDDNTDNDLEFTDNMRQVRQYVAQVDNLRMSTKYSFHIRSADQRKNMKITGRSELFDNEIEGEDFLANNMAQGQTIIVPTKGFSAQATRCLPTASEIEVETGPYFGGKIVVDGGNCGLKGDPNDPKEKYVMRIDHKMCGSMVKPETNTVETFITVQENLGIFTHSTRRFVVVCSYQSGLQTVRASFSVPGRGGASAVQQDQYEEDERMGRGLKPMRYVDKSELILKETTEEESTNAVSTSEETQAMVEEMDNPTINYNNSSIADDVITNAVATLENISPGVDEKYIKETETSENEQQNGEVNTETMNSDKEIQAENLTEQSNTTTDESEKEEEKEDEKEPKEGHEKFSAKFAKLTRELNEQEVQPLRRVDSINDGDDMFSLTSTGRDFGSGLELITLNMGSVLLTVLLSVILIGIFLYVLIRETKLPARIEHAPTTRASPTPTLNASCRHLQHNHLEEAAGDTLPRTLRTKNQDLMA